VKIVAPELAQKRHDDGKSQGPWQAVPAQPVVDQIGERDPGAPWRRAIMEMCVGPRPTADRGGQRQRQDHQKPGSSHPPLFAFHVSHSGSDPAPLPINAIGGSWICEWQLPVSR
jgi:hypothetical protein